MLAALVGHKNCSVAKTWGIIHGRQDHASAPCLVSGHDSCRRRRCGSALSDCSGVAFQQDIGNEVVEADYRHHDAKCLLGERC